MCVSSLPGWWHAGSLPAPEPPLHSTGTQHPPHPQKPLRHGHKTGTLYIYCTLYMYTCTPFVCVHVIHVLLFGTSSCLPTYNVPHVHVHVHVHVQVHVPVHVQYVYAYMYFPLSSYMHIACTCFLLSLSLPPSLQDHLDDLLRQLISLLSSNDVTTVTCSAGVLCNLTCNNPKNKTILCQLHGVEVCVCVAVGGGGLVISCS